MIYIYILYMYTYILYNVYIYCSIKYEKYIKALPDQQ